MEGHVSNESQVFGMLYVCEDLNWVINTKNSCVSRLNISGCLGTFLGFSRTWLATWIIENRQIFIYPLQTGLPAALSNRFLCCARYLKYIGN